VGDQLVFMHQGRIHEQGHPKELFAKPGTAELASFVASVA
jgi:polar amino acid transport system ATP-binding protein